MSDADVPFLDYCDFRITGEAPRRYTRIVVDEAQDLSPMQMGMISRRSRRGSMTVMGDIAQSTGPWARDQWDDVIASLRGEVAPNVVELEYGYRVPRQIFEFAAALLPHAAAGVRPPTVVRDGPSEPKIVRRSRDEVCAAAVEAAMTYSSLGNLVGVVCPVALWQPVVDNLDERGVRWRDVTEHGISAGINVLSPTASKGLEFDTIVVIEPETIAGEDPHGLRLLYIAYTHTTRHLTVVTSGLALPIPLSPEENFDRRGRGIRRTSRA